MKKAKEFVKNKWIVAAMILVIISIVFRIIGISFKSFEYDTIVTQNTWAESAISMGLNNFWSNYSWSVDYLPGAIVFDVIIKFIANIFNSSPQAFVVTIKIFNNLIDLIFSLAIYWIMITRLDVKKDKSFFYSALFFISPAALYVSGYWGQFDSLIVMLVFISIYLMVFEIKYADHFVLSGMVYALALSLKLQPAVYLPFIMIFLIVTYKFNALLKYLGGFLVVITAINIPPIIISPLRTVWVFIQPFIRGGSISRGANTFWGLFSQLNNKADSLINLRFIQISVSTCGIIIFLILLGVILVRVYRMGITKAGDRTKFLLIIYFIAGLNLIYYMFMMEMHSRYAQFTAIFIFFLVAFIKKGISRILVWTSGILFSVSYTLNQISVHYWWYRDAFPVFWQYIFQTAWLTPVLIFTNLAFLIIFIFKFKIN